MLEKGNICMLLHIIDALLQQQKNNTPKFYLSIILSMNQVNIIEIYLYANITRMCVKTMKKKNSTNLDSV